MSDERPLFSALRAAARSSWQSTVVTALALLYARMLGAKPRFEGRTRLFIASGMRGGFARAGTTVGGVFLTGKDPSARLIRHESVHADQWARYGFTFPVRYWIEELRNPRGKNRFEIEAGLEDGGYVG
ncbi:hypothetical protein [Hoyosella subflava]|uniref:Fe-S oxidoreductase n=1 Tax=Hoyosella subflava (strain DSM 45089 / JCM 17490 / NBRC 109087 / DQS3-9A1) TaxID=443218 RepID=F6EFZ3_HOYSD|nr:hypothetical protein [Hoyosella subflava]AEF42257.1 hypothetical protein AS9A_3819 [Hoyosella subflava DQS3-9A1]